MFSHHVEPKTPSINCFCFSLLHAIGPSFIWNGFFFLSQNFVPLCIGHLEKFWFTEFAGLPKADTFHYTILKKKSCMLKSAPIP